MSNIVFNSDNNRYFGWDNCDGLFREEADYEIDQTEAQEQSSCKEKNLVSLMSDPLNQQIPAQLTVTKVDVVPSASSPCEPALFQAEVVKEKVLNANATQTFQKTYPLRKRKEPETVEEPEREAKRLKTDKDSRTRVSGKRKKQTLGELRSEERRLFVKLNDLISRKSKLVEKCQHFSQASSSSVSVVKKYTDLCKEISLDDDFVVPDTKHLSAKGKAQEQEKKRRGREREEREFLQDRINMLANDYIPALQQEIKEIVTFNKSVTAQKPSIPVQKVPSQSSSNKSVDFYMSLDQFFGPDHRSVL